MNRLYDLFIHELKDMYSAEKQIVHAMPEMIYAAKSTRLKDALQAHLEESKEQIKRLDSIASELGEDFSRAECDGIQGILKEAGKFIQTGVQDDIQDAGIIGMAQRVEHYEIAVYGTLKALAKELNFPQIEKHLDESMREEMGADKKLTEIAEGTLFHKGVNKKASRCERG